MERGISKLTEEFIAEVIEEHLSDARKRSYELQQYNQKIIEITSEVSHILKKLDEKDREILKKYKGAFLEEEAICFSELYLAGIKDGIQLLKLLEIV